LNLTGRNKEKALKLRKYAAWWGRDEDCNISFFAFITISGSD
jgi:hypothetical protein